MVKIKGNKAHNKGHILAKECGWMMTMQVTLNTSQVIWITIMCSEYTKFNDN